MTRKTPVNPYAALEAGQGFRKKSHFPVMEVLEQSLSDQKMIETNLVDDWGPLDRAGEEGVTAVTPSDEETEQSLSELKRSISEDGQQVPALLRPSKESAGRYEIIYGNRRLRACRELGIPLKALVENMDDRAALRAKGLENAARRPLSFYEKALFAQGIRKQGYSAAEVGQSMNLSKTGVRNLTRITSAVPKAVGLQLTPARTSGRPKWTKLAEAFEQGSVTEEIALRILEPHLDLTSDQRLDKLLAEISSRPKLAPPEREPVKGIKIKVGQGVSMKVAKGPFADWLNDNLDDVLTKLYDEFKATSKTEE
jgi:ParB family chromosome partitioning protein